MNVARYWHRMNRPCRRCGHPRLTHAHHRHGTDCATCNCPRYRPRWLT